MESLIQGALSLCQNADSVQERKEVLNNLFEIYKDEEIEIIKYLLIDIISHRSTVNKPASNSKLGTIPFITTNVCLLNI